MSQRAIKQYLYHGGGFHGTNIEPPPGMKESAALSMFALCGPANLFLELSTHVVNILNRV